LIHPDGDPILGRRRDFQNAKAEMQADTKVTFDLEAFLPYRINRAAEWISLSFAMEYKARYGMTRPEWRALAALGSLGRMTATEIGTHSAMHKTKVSRAVKALEDRRWLTRTENGDDRRMEYLELTATGHTSYQELARIAGSYAETLKSLLGQQGLSQLERGLAAVEAAARSDSKNCELKVRFE
jgi:DNA-binding MarR family transcriptional regulator